MTCFFAQVIIEILSALIAAGLPMKWLPVGAGTSPHFIQVCKLLLVDLEVPFPETDWYLWSDQRFFDEILPLMYDRGLKTVDMFDVPPSIVCGDRLKMAMLRQAPDSWMLPFDDREMNLYFRRLENRAVSLCDHLPVELASQVVSRLSEYRCLHSPRVFKRMVERQSLAHQVVTIS